MKRLLRRRKGFTLVEIMLVVTIIGLLVAIAVVSVLRAIINANEASSKASLRLIANACHSYRMAQGQSTFPSSLQDLATTSPPYIDSVLASGRKQGYQFTYNKVNDYQYTCLSVPIISNVTGNHRYQVTETGIIVDADTAIPIE